MNSANDVDFRRAVRLLTLQFTALIVVLLVAVGGLIFFIVSTSTAESNERTLMEASEVDSPRDAPTGVLVAIADDGRVMQSRDLPSGLPDVAAMQTVQSTRTPLRSQVEVDGHTYDVQTTAEGDRVTQVAIDLHESQEEVGRLFWALVVSGAIAAVIAAFIAWWMARRAMRPLADALSLQRRFVADASHELRTPLTLLSMRAQLLKRQHAGSSAELSSGMTEIVQDTKVLGEILEDLLISADPRETAERAPVDLCALADEVVASLGTQAEGQAQGRSITLERGGSAEPVIVSGARVSLGRLFTALVSNALDHAASSVTVTVAVEGREAVVRVADDGPGFPEGVGARAFERFASSRVAPDAGTVSSAASTSPSRHYGIGLALVAEVAARHDGTVRVEPTVPGRGAVVVVRLPLASSGRTDRQRRRSLTRMFRQK